MEIDLPGINNSFLSGLEGNEEKERFVASMVLPGIGDAMGYKNGMWEFNYSGESIHKECEELGGVENLDLTGWMVSDDTVMHLATAEALVFFPEKMNPSLSQLFPKIAEKYVECFSDMAGRAPGGTTGGSVSFLASGAKWDEIPFGRHSGGCGGSMRAMPIGLRFFGEPRRDLLISVSIESGRMTHNHPVGFLGSFIAALFTAYAIEKIPIVEWGRKFLQIIPQAYKYLEQKKRDWEDYQDTLKYTEDKFREYLTLRGIIEEGANDPRFPENFGPAQRDAFYKSVSFSGWGGSSGHDSCLIAYDALLGCKGNWKEFCLRGVLHGGDSDSTGCIGAAWFGAFYGFKGVYPINYEHLEYKERLKKLGEQLYELRKAPFQM